MPVSESPELFKPGQIATVPVAGGTIEVRPKNVKAPRAPSRTDRARGVLRHSIGGESYIIEMRQTGIVVRRPRHRHRDTKSIDQIIDFIIGQERLKV